MILYALLGGFIIISLGYLWVLDRTARRYQKSLDSLTTKIVAPQTVTAYDPKTAPKENKAPTISRPNVPLGEANPNDVIEALELEMGIRER